jgi:NAD(P)-dependent dehydrogenase (short-subunit alcohol dehydrogenase family)
MVNNAGVGLEARAPAPVHLTEESIWDTTMRINAKSVFLGCKYAAGQMLKQEPHVSGDRGWIINMSSIMGIIASQDHRMSVFCVLCSAFCISARNKYPRGGVLLFILKQRGRLVLTNC